MPWSAKLTTRELTQLGILLALALSLRLVENSLAALLPLPGAHLGLANIMTIIVLYLYGTKRALLFLTARIVLVGLLFTGLFSPGFFIGLGGALLSFVAMALGAQKEFFSPIGVGLLGAFCHNVGQICVAMFLMHSQALMSYLPFLILLGIPTGIFTGLVAKLFLKRKLK